MNRWNRALRALPLFAALLACMPLAFALTMLGAPLCGWFEARTGIEALGHSGPAGWCFWLTLVLCWLCVLVVFRRSRRRLPVA